MKLLFALLLIAPASQAFASSSPTSGDVRQAVVRYSDLNLRNPAGAALLRHRIDQKVVALSDAANPVDPNARARLAAARARGQAQASCLIAAANSNVGTAYAPVS